MSLPPDDRATSPYTGWTRTHWEVLADHLLDSLVPYFSPGAARVILPGRTSQSGADSDALEGFARSFMLAAFRIAGAQGKDCDALIERYARGLVAGADRDHPEAWLRLRSRTQPLVEAAAIAVALHESRAWVWDRLDDRDRQVVADWLGGFIGAEPFDNNWRLFQVVSEQFLASVGAPYRRDEIDAGLDRIEDWYLGGGWYTDGDGQNFDHYAGWAMHLYPGLWARMAAATPGATYADRLDTYRERLRLFLADAVHLVGTDGAPVHQGRSLTYRMATAAQFWMGALLDATPLSPGTTRRVCSGIARHFTEHGAPDENGLLTLGWYDPFLPATQTYSGPGSPYWAGKGFVGLLLPPDHPVWTDTEQAAPLDETDQVRAMPQPGWLVHSTQADGIVRLLNHGSDRVPVAEPDGPEPPADAHYDRLAYASRTGPDHTADRVDNHVALMDGDLTSTRGRIRRIGTASSWHRAWLGSGGPWRIETTSVVYAGTEIRCSLVDGPPGCTVRTGGYAVAGETLPQASTGAAEATVRSGLVSTIRNLYGYDGVGVRSSTGTNAFGPHSATPYLTRSNHPGSPLVLVCAVTLGDDEARVGVTVEDRTVTVHLPDGSAEQIVLGAVHRE
jgi:hypothetical protein